MSHLTSLATALLAGALMTDTTHAEQPTLGLQFAGALEFADDGTLFVGDNYRGAVYAFEIPAEASTTEIQPSSVLNIDTRIAELLGVGVGAIEINDIATHPISDDIYISVTRIGNFASQPAIVTVSPDNRLQLLDMSALTFTKQELNAFPDAQTTFTVRGARRVGILPRDQAKGSVAVRSLAIMDMEFYDGELFVAGVAHDDFQSSLRRIAYPFEGSQSLASVDMYHIVHDQYESRAPIRAMSVQQVDGKAQLVAAYTCSPVVLIPLEDIEDGAQISASTIMDMGNGQPLDMVPFQMGDEPMLFVTNHSRSPRVIPVAGLSGARVVTDEDFERGPKLDMHPVMPFGPVGKHVMFDGVSLHIARLGDSHFASVTRDAYTGTLNLDINPTFFPNRMHNFFAESDIPASNNAEPRR